MGESLEYRMSKIYITSLEFSRTPLVEAIVILNQKSIELEFREDRPDQRGINFVCLNSIQTNPENKISFAADNLYLSEYLIYFTQVAGCELAVLDLAVILGTEAETEKTADEINRYHNGVGFGRVPSIELSDTPIVDALEFIQQKSSELDYYESDPGRKGFQMEITPAARRSEATVNLSMNNVPIIDLLVYLTQISKLQMDIKTHKVVFDRSD